MANQIVPLNPNPGNENPQTQPGFLTKVWCMLMPFRQQAATEVEQQLNDENVQQVFNRVVQPFLTSAGFALRDVLRNVLVELLTGDRPGPRFPALEQPLIE